MVEEVVSPALRALFDGCCGHVEPVDWVVSKEPEDGGDGDGVCLGVAEVELCCDGDVEVREDVEELAEDRDDWLVASKEEPAADRRGEDGS